VNTALPRLDFNETITLTSDITSSATSITVTPSTALATSGIFPVDVTIGGEQITVASATVSGGDLILGGCTRHVNGIVKAHTSGDRVWLANSFRLTLIRH